MFTQSALVKTFFAISIWILIILLITVYNSGYDKNKQKYSEENSEKSYIVSKELNNSEMEEDSSPLIVEPDVYGIPYNWSRSTSFQQDLYNTQWQTYTNLNVSFKLFGAYYDKRPSVSEGKVVRILAMVNQLENKFPVNYCRIWFENEQRYTVMPIISYKIIWFSMWGKNQIVFYPYLLTCKVSELEKSIPKNISLISKLDEHPSNNLNIIYEPLVNNSQAKFAVCVKALDFRDIDISKRLVEWLELIRILGAEKVVVYVLNINENIKKIFEYYAKENFVKAKPLTLVNPNTPGLNKRLNEVIPYNDCFYRNIYKYEYVINIDIDEVIMPLGNLTSWHDLANIAKQMQLQKSKRCPYGFAGICFKNAYFPNFSKNSTLTPSLPPSLTSVNSSLFSNAASSFYMLQHTKKLAKYSHKDFATKCFHKTSQALTLHNHYALKWLKSCKPATMSTKFGQLQHYRTLNKKHSYRKVEVVEDRSIWRFWEQLVRNSMHIWEELVLMS